MHDPWTRLSERSRQHALPRRGVEQISASYDVGHPLLAVVNDNHELVSPEPVGPLDDKVAGLGLYVLLLRAHPAIIKLLVPRRRDEPPRTDGTGGWRLPTASARVWARAQHAASAGAAEHQALGLQLFEIGPI